MKQLTCAALLFFANLALAQDSVPRLTEEDLTPFCANEMIWEHYNVKPEQCMKVAKPCADKIAESGTTDLGAATEQLYACVFEGLDIQLPIE